MRQKSQEDYLRTIYILSEKRGDYSVGVKSIDIAKYLKISKSAVCQMLGKLVEEGLVKTKPYSSVSLTKKGFKRAKRITHNYRIMEVFLKDILSYRHLNKISQEAHKLEHAFSEASFRRLDKFLNNPKKCPHGNIIHQSKRGVF